MNNRLQDIIHDVGAKSFAKALMYETRCAEAGLRCGSTNFTQLSTILR